MTGTESDPKLFHCQVLGALKVISGKWKTRILWVLRERPYHFNELKRILPGVSAKVLTEQIRQLENAGIIFRSENNVNGQQQSDYAYTDYGKTLIPALDALGNWGLAHELADASQ